jgi:hypothetical protein
VRVHEELAAEGAALSYSALTAFCRKQGIGQAPVVAAGRYHFEPGEEIQHDTSPHEVQLAGKKRKVQTASGVLCYSRMMFFQCYPTFERFDVGVGIGEVFRTVRARHQQDGVDVKMNAEFVGDLQEPQLDTLVRTAARPAECTGKKENPDPMVLGGG